MSSLNWGSDSRIIQSDSVHLLHTGGAPVFCVVVVVVVVVVVLSNSYLCSSSQPKCHFFQYTFSASFQLHEKRDQIYLVPTNLQLLKENLKHGRICLKLGLRYSGYRMNITQV